MKKRKSKGSKTLLVCLLVLSLTCGCNRPETDPVAESTVPQATLTQPTTPEEPVIVEPAGYKSAIPCGTGFLACGTGGRVDSIALDGTVTPCDTGTEQNLFDIYAEGNRVVACGDQGTIILSTDGGNTFRSIGPNTDHRISAVATYRGTLYAAGEQGIIYRENNGNWQSIQMETNQDLIGLVVTTSGIAAVSAQTDVCFSQDGNEWQHENFNEVYDGMYPTYVFTRLIPAGDTFFVLGYPEENPNQPLIMYTATTDMNGDVWMQRDMMKINGEYVTEEMVIPIHDICFNVDQIVGVLDDGAVLAITDCTVCNELKTLDGAGDLWATAAREDSVLVCGEDFFAQVLSSKQIRQDKIGAEQARDDVSYGNALLIDVREADELAADGYIPGSIHVPLAEVEERLPELAPDFYQEIIFYCASGMRSQKATELAVDMGYISVYNLGGLTDWPYEIVKE